MNLVVALQLPSIKPLDSNMLRAPELAVVGGKLNRRLIVNVDAGRRLLIAKLNETFSDELNVVAAQGKLNEFGFGGAERDDGMELGLEADRCIAQHSHEAACALPCHGVISKAGVGVSPEMCVGCRCRIRLSS